MRATAARVPFLVFALVIASIERALPGVSVGSIPVSATVASSCAVQVTEASPPAVLCVRGTHVVIDIGILDERGRMVLAQAGGPSQYPLGAPPPPPVVTVLF